MTGRLAWVLVICAVAPRLVYAQATPVVTEIRVEQEGRLVDDRVISSLIETRTGEPLSMRDVRETLSHLTSLNRFEDVQVFQEAAGAGVRLRYVLLPLHPVDRIEFRGVLGLSEREIRQVVTDRFWAPRRLRAAQRTWRRRYPSSIGTAAMSRCRLHPGLEATHDPDRATMAFDIQAGPARDDRTGRDRAGSAAVAGWRLLATSPWAPVTPSTTTRILAELDRYLAALRARGFYEARALHTTFFEPTGTATVRITVDSGPLVSVAFAGDPLPEAERERLVPVRTEGSADEDLLEDASVAIEEYLRVRGYRSAAVEFMRDGARRSADDHLHGCARFAVRRRRGHDRRQRRGTVGCSRRASAGRAGQFLRRGGGGRDRRRDPRSVSGPRVYQRRPCRPRWWSCRAITRGAAAAIVWWTSGSR